MGDGGGEEGKVMSEKRDEKENIRKLLLKLPSCIGKERTPPTNTHTQEKQEKGHSYKTHTIFHRQTWGSKG